MLTFHSSGAARKEISGDPPKGMELPPDVVWIDMFDPDEREIAQIAQATGLRIPSFDNLAEVESSSRLVIEGRAVYLSNPFVFRTEAGAPRVTPVGFVLTPDLLITIRFQEIKAFATFREHIARTDALLASSMKAFVGLMEALVDRMADLLEHVASELDHVSIEIFGDEPGQHIHRPKRENAKLRGMLRRVGRSGDLASKIRHSLLGVARLTPYVETNTADWLSAELKARLETLRQDVNSLDDYETRLSYKVQILLDSTHGFTNIEQNTTFNILTIVSVVGIPPTLVAGIYGMNFKGMPEYDWAWGYPYGLTMIALSAIVPLVWFKVRGWF